MKKCPFCAEEIKAEAIVCKHCKKDIPAETGKEREARYLASLSEEERAKMLKNKKTIERILFLMILFIVGTCINRFFGLFFIIFIVSYYLGKYLLKKHKEQDLKTRFSNIINKKHNRIIIVTTVVVVLIISGALITNSALEKQKQDSERQKQEMIAKYPVPKIEILSSKEPQGKSEKYLLKLNVTNAENLTISYGGINAIEKTLTGTAKEGLVEQEVPLLLPESSISIEAKNIYKTSQESILIKRDKNPEELTKEKEEQKNAQIASIKDEISDKEREISQKQGYIDSFDAPFGEYQRINDMYFANSNLSANKDQFAVRVWQKDIAQLRSEINSLNYKLKTVK